ncbi:MAG: calcium-binding protein [Roseovarius sp.]|nr:calcium-binding protein [Roseovarius sp.]
MLMFASLLGLAAVSATAFVGFTETVREEGEDDIDPVDDPAMRPGEADLFEALARPADITDATGPNDPVPPEGGAQIIEGGPGDDLIIGGDAPEMIAGRDGDDTIAAGAGADELRGGAGDDILRGGAGADTLHGDDGHDLLEGGEGDDRLFGHNGDDMLDGGPGDDSIVGGAGDDRLLGGEGDDALHGVLGDDWLHGGPGADTLFGGHGNDTVIGTVDDPASARFDDIDTGRDYLNGGGGDDVILAGSGDIVTTGTGADRVLLGDWISADRPAEILDFSIAEDMLVVFHDETGPTPEIALEPDAENPADQRLLLDGVEIARIADAPGLTLGHVTLMPQSDLARVARL